MHYFPAGSRLSSHLAGESPARADESGLSRFIESYTEILLDLGSPEEGAASAELLSEASVEAIKAECEEFCKNRAADIMAYQGHGHPYEKAGAAFFVTRNRIFLSFREDPWVDESKAYVRLEDAALAFGDSSVEWAPDGSGQLLYQSDWKPQEDTE